MSPMIVPKKTGSFQASPGNRPSPCPGSMVLHALLPLEQPPELAWLFCPLKTCSDKLADQQLVTLKLLSPPLKMLNHLPIF